MNSLFDNLVAETIEEMAEALAPAYNEPMLIKSPFGSWRVTEYDYDACSIARDAGGTVLFWRDGEWRE